MQPEAILQAGAELCQNGNLTGGIAKFREALKCNPRPGTRMILNHNLALALSVEGGVVWGPGGRVPVNNDNVAFLDEALERWSEVCKIYQKEVERTSEEEEFSCEPSLKEYMKIASNNGFAISVKIDKFRSSGIYEHEKQEKKSGCFIATACYGSYAAPEVLVLRQFRDEVLLESMGGRSFVRFYYTVSPPIARFIQRREKLKEWVRYYLVSRIVRMIDKG